MVTERPPEVKRPPAGTCSSCETPALTLHPYRTPQGGGGGLCGACAAISATCDGCGHRYAADRLRIIGPTWLPRLLCPACDRSGVPCACGCGARVPVALAVAQSHVRRFPWPLTLLCYERQLEAEYGADDDRLLCDHCGTLRDRAEVTADTFWCAESQGLETAHCCRECAGGHGDA